jgi:hypothetical protein
MKTIVWDIDDVLNDLTRAWFEGVWLKTHKNLGMRYENLLENPPDKLLNISKADYLSSLDQFRLSPEAEDMDPEKGVLRWFMESGENFRHLALTARPIKTMSPAASWLLKHFGEWFQAISFVPSWRIDENPKQADRTKHEFLQWLGKADYFIDDHSENVRKAKELGVKVFLVSQPWNNSQLKLLDILKIINKENQY